MACSTLDLIEKDCLNISAGYEYGFDLLVTDSADEAIDITGFDFNMSIKDNANSVPLLSLTTSLDDAVTGFFIVDALAGLFRLKITSTDTATLKKGFHLYEISQTDLAGELTLFMQGKIQSIKGIL